MKVSVLSAKGKIKKMFAEAIMDFCQVLFKVNNNIYIYLYIIYTYIMQRHWYTQTPNTSKIKQCTEFYCIDTHTHTTREEINCSLLFNNDSQFHNRSVLSEDKLQQFYY